MVASDRLAEVLKTFAVTLVTEYAVEDMLDQLCKDVCAVLDVDGAGVMLEDDGGALRFVAASDDIVRAIEALQIELGEGPCLHTYRTGTVTMVDDLARDDRFPQFSPRALDAGLAAVHSFPLAASDETIGAINVYTAAPTALDDHGREAGVLLASLATTYILNARTLAASHRLTGQLQHALDSRIVIEQAKGKLSEQLQLPLADAFEVMRRHARNNGAKLHDVAAQIIDGSLRLSQS